MATALNRQGIRHLAPRQRAGGRLATGAELFQCLAEASAVRLQEAAIVLLLTSPELAGEARVAIERLQGPARRRAMARYVAAAALQRMWRTRLLTDLGPQPWIAPAYLQELGLPELDGDFGRTTLRALCQQEEALYGHDAWAGYTSLMDLFLAEIQLKGWGRRSARTG